MEVHHMYFTGVQTEFWNSPTRPYYLVLPADGAITAVVPSISETLYQDICEFGSFGLSIVVATVVVGEI